MKLDITIHTCISHERDYLREQRFGSLMPVMNYNLILNLLLNLHFLLFAI